MSGDVSKVGIILQILDQAVADVLALEPESEAEHGQGPPGQQAGPQGPAKRLSRIIEPEYAALARKMFSERRQRDAIFDTPGLFGEPAWDILLDLTIARERGLKLSVSAITIRSDTAPTTALRYLAVLDKLGLSERTPDPDDARRHWVRISDKGYRLMKLFFDVASGEVVSKHEAGPMRADMLRPVNT